MLTHTLTHTRAHTPLLTPDLALMSDGPFLADDELLEDGDLSSFIIILSIYLVRAWPW